MILDNLNKALEEKFLFDSSYKNICEFLELDPSPRWVRESLDELVNAENWKEINDRFPRTLPLELGE